jgi:methionyl-tRNA formyltransferase
MGVPSVGAIVDSAHELALVVTQPARPAGRGGKLRRTPAAEAASARGVSVLECPDVNAAEAIEAIQAARPDVLCVVDFGQMIGQAVRELAPHQSFNLHGSILPALRGAAPINWAIINGDERTGLTTFRVVEAMDAGPVYLTCETDIRPDETAEDLKPRLATLGAQLVCETLYLLESGQAELHEQDHSLKTLAPKLTKVDGRIDFSGDAAGVRNRIHGTWPWPGGQARLERQAGKPVNVVVARAEVAEADDAEEQGDLTPGTFDDDLTVQTGQGRLAIVEIKPAGKTLMPFADFVNGYRVAPGDRFIAIEDDDGR